MYIRIFLAARNHFIYTTLRGFNTFICLSGHCLRFFHSCTALYTSFKKCGALTHDIQPLSEIPLIVILGRDPSIQRRVFCMDSRNKSENDVCKVFYMYSRNKSENDVWRVSENDGEWGIPFWLKFSQKVVKTMCRSFKTLWNRMFRIYRERERPLISLFFIFLSS